jgi:Domain of unknown function (DUF4214)/Glycosyl hydrolase catalytic core
MVLRSITVAAFFLGVTTAASADFLWGVNGHPIVAYPGIPVGQQLDYIKDLGLKSYRVNISNVEDGSKLAVLVKEAKPRGIDILPVVTPGNINLEKDSTDDLYQKARALAVGLGSQFKDDIRVWELGNEMENYAILKSCEMRDDGSKYPCEWGDAGGVGPLEYYGPRWAKVSAVLKGLSDGMISVDPTILKAMGTAGWGHVGAFERMKRDGIEWDISVWHMYGDDPEWAFKFLATYGKPIWVTEFNSPYGSQRGERKQADGLKQQMLRLQELQATYKVEAAHVYELLDETYWAPDFEAYMGLVHLLPKPDGGWITGEPKPAYFALRDTIRGVMPLPEPKRDCAPDGIQNTGPSSQASFAHCLILGSKGNSETIKRWTAALENGEASLDGLLMYAIRSDEFSRLYATYSLSNRAYVAFLYRLLLDRDADSSGLNSYAGQLTKGSMTRETVAYWIVTSSEFRDKHRASLPSEVTAGN